MELVWRLLCVIQTLRRTLDSRGFQHVGIIAADMSPSAAWSIADDILKDQELFNAVSILGLVLTHQTTILLLLLFKYKYYVVVVVVVVDSWEADALKRCGIPPDSRSPEIHLWCQCCHWSDADVPLSTLDMIEVNTQCLLPTTTVWTDWRCN